MTDTEEPILLGVAARAEILPRGRLMFQGRNVDRGPTLTLGTFSQLFFAQTYRWLRFRLDRMQWKAPEQTGPKVKLNLADMEIVVHGLCHYDYISVDDLQHALLTLWWLGHLHGVLEKQ